MGFRDLLDLEFRLKPEVLEQVWKRLFENKAKIKFSLDTSELPWKFENLKISNRIVTIENICYSFTHKARTYFVSEVEQSGHNIIFYFVRVDPTDRKRSFANLVSKSKDDHFISVVFDLDTGILKTWGSGKVKFPIPITKNFDEEIIISNIIKICPENYLYFITLMSQKIVDPK